MRMGTARGAAWSFPPPTCTSWRVESLPTTGPYLTRERSPWASVLSRPPASPGTVRKSTIVRDENCFFKICIKVNALHLCYCVGGVGLIWTVGVVFHMLLFWTLVLHGSNCISFVTANFFFPMFGCENVNLPLCQVLLTLMRTVSGS